MQHALDNATNIDQESKTRMLNFFRHTAYFLVAGNDLKNESQGPPPCKHGDNKPAAEFFFFFGGVQKRSDLNRLVTQKGKQMHVPSIIDLNDNWSFLHVFMSRARARFVDPSTDQIFN
ncbi:hypothetical protein Hanom_Chr01g00038951 [Helianthus anomalus]